MLLDPKPLGKLTYVQTRANLPTVHTRLLDVHLRSFCIPTMATSVAGGTDDRPQSSPAPGGAADR